MTKPLATFSLVIRTGRKHRGRKRLKVCIRKHVNELRRAAQDVTGRGGWYDTAGCYLSVRTPRQFGEIHLWQRLMGAGYFAHELQHFIADYADETETPGYVLDGKANERMAFLAGDLTAQFWTKFYDTFELKL